MKAILFAMSAAALLSPLALAEDPAPPAPATSPATGPTTRLGPRIETGLARLDVFRKLMNDELQLSPEQQKQLDDIMKNAREQVQTMVADFQKNQTNPEDRVAAMQKWTQELRTKAEAMLTDQQKQKLQERVGALRSPEGMMNALFERVQAVLDKMKLSDDQQAKVKDILTAAKTKAAQLRDDQSNTGPQMWQKFQQLMREMAEQVAPILTPEQRQEWRQEIEKLRPARGAN